MRRLLINMQSNLFATAITNAIKASSLEFDCYISKDAKEIKETMAWFSPSIILLEVTTISPYSIDERIDLINSLKKNTPELKVVFVVDEYVSKELTTKVKECKKKAIIDQFVYGSVTSSFLVDLLDSLV